MTMPVNNVATIQGVSTNVANNAAVSNTAERDLVVKTMLDQANKDHAEIAQLKTAILQKPQNPYERGSEAMRAQVMSRLRDFAAYVVGAQGLNWGRDEPHEKETNRIVNRFIDKIETLLPTATDEQMRQTISKVHELQAQVHNGGGRGRGPSNPNEKWTPGDDGVGMGIYDSVIADGLAAASQPLEQGKLSADWQERQTQDQSAKLSNLLGMQSQGMDLIRGNLRQLTQPMSMKTDNKDVKSAYDDEDDEDDENQKVAQPVAQQRNGQFPSLSVNVMYG